MSDTAAWVEACATSAAFLAASTAVVLEGIAGRKRDREMRHRFDLERRHLAAGVAVYPDVGSEITERTGLRVFEVIEVANRGDLPVSAVWLEHRGEPVVKWAVLGPGAVVSHQPAAIRPSADDPVDLERWCVTFTDANGVRWVRSGTGRLLELGVS